MDPQAPLQARAADPSTAPGADPAAAKACLRAQVRRRRRALSGPALEAAAAALAAHAPEVARLAPAGGAIAAYAAAPGEPDLTAAFAAWHREGHPVLLPRSLPGRALEWVRWEPGLELARGAHAPVPEPVGGVPASPDTARVVLVPALAVSRAGIRLGQGGGFYDTFLEHHAGVHVGVLHAGELLPTVPAQPWDATLDAVLTPEGLLRLPLPPA